MKERWLVRLLVDRDPDTDAPPDQWEWPDAEAVLPAELVGVVAPDPVPAEVVDAAKRTFNGRAGG